MSTLKYSEKTGNIFNYLKNDIKLIQCISSECSPVTELDRAIEEKYHNYSFIKDKYPNYTWCGKPQIVETPGVINFVLKQYNNQEPDFSCFMRLLYQVTQSDEAPSRVIINRRSISNFQNWSEWDLYAGAIREIMGLINCEVIVFYETELLTVEIKEIGI